MLLVSRLIKHCLVSLTNRKKIIVKKNVEQEEIAQWKEILKILIWDFKTHPIKHKILRWSSGEHTSVISILARKSWKKNLLEFIKKSAKNQEIIFHRLDSSLIQTSSTFSFRTCSSFYAHTFDWRFRFVWIQQKVGRSEENPD